MTAIAFDDIDAINAARKKKKPFPYPPVEMHGYIHKWWEETDEDRRRRAVRTWRAGFTSNEDFFTAEAAGFPFKIGYDALVEAGFKANRPRYAGRPEAASTATGLLKRHQAEQAALMEQALEG